jgi:hypothetical protein
MVAASQAGQHRSRVVLIRRFLEHDTSENNYRVSGNDQSVRSDCRNVITLGARGVLGKRDRVLAGSPRPLGFRGRRHDLEL